MKVCLGTSHLEGLETPESNDIWQQEVEHFAANSTELSSGTPLEIQWALPLFKHVNSSDSAKDPKESKYPQEQEHVSAEKKCKSLPEKEQGSLLPRRAS
jgi:hypothetical protein